VELEEMNKLKMTPSPLEFVEYKNEQSKVTENDFKIRTSLHVLNNAGSSAYNN
jgi:hypothetical protein